MPKIDTPRDLLAYFLAVAAALRRAARRRRRCSRPSPRFYSTGISVTLRAA